MTEVCEKMNEGTTYLFGISLSDLLVNLAPLLGLIPMIDTPSSTGSECDIKSPTSSILERQLCIIRVYRFSQVLDEDAGR